MYPLHAANIADDLSCMGYETRSDDLYIYGSGSGYDIDSITSIRKAKLVARQRISSQIEIIVNSTTEMYLSTITKGNITQTKEYLYTTAATTSKQLLMGSSIVCQNTIKTAEQQYYISSVALELPTDNIITAFGEQFSSFNIDWKKYNEILKSKIQIEP